MSSWSELLDDAMLEDFWRLARDLNRFGGYDPYNSLDPVRFEEGFDFCGLLDDNAPDARHTQ